MGISKKVRRANYKRYLHACAVYLTAAGWTEAGPAKQFDDSLWQSPGKGKEEFPYVTRAAVFKQESEDRKLGDK